MIISNPDPIFRSGAIIHKNPMNPTGSYNQMILRLEVSIETSKKGIESK